MIKKILLSLLVIPILVLAIIYVNNNLVKNRYKTDERNVVISDSFERYMNVPRVYATNILETEKLSYNLPIEINFTKDMDKDSVESSFSIEPKINGDFVWENKKTVSFKPSDNFEKDQKYQFSISKNAITLDGEELVEQYNREFITTEAPDIVLVSPEGEVSVDTEITVMFSKPIFALSVLDITDQYDYPLKIEPAIEGRFKILGTNSFQFVPQTDKEQRLPFSTSFKAMIDKEFLGSKEDYVFKFQTPELDVIDRSKELVNDEPYRLVFNQPVDKDSLEEYLVIQKENENISYNIAYANKEIYKNGKKEIIDLDNIIEITLDNNFGYDNIYRFILKKGFYGKEGNLPCKTGFNEVLEVKSFVDNISPNMDDRVGVLSQPIITFHEEVMLDSIEDSVSFSPDINFSYEYIEECEIYKDEKEIENIDDDICKKYVVNKKRVKIIPSVPLVFNQTYNLSISDSIQTVDGAYKMGKDYTKEFNVADAPQIIGYNHDGSYTQFCIFSNNPINTKDLKDKISFTPAIDRDIMGYSYKLKYSNEKTYANICNIKEYDGKYATMINLKMDPNTSYDVILNDNFDDFYKQKLISAFKFKIKTEDIRYEDTDIRLINNDFYNFIPYKSSNDLEVVTKNIPVLDIEICKLDFQKYLQTDKNKDGKYGDFWGEIAIGNTFCDKYLSYKEILGNKYWDPVYTAIPVQDKMKEEGIYYIRLTSPYFKREEYDWRDNIKIKTGEIQKITDTVLVVSKNAVFVKDIGNKKMLIWGLDILSGKEKTGLKFNLYDDYGNIVKSSIEYIGDGIYTGSIDEWKYIEIIDEGVSSFITYAWDTRIRPENNRFETGGSNYIYTERPIYRPGQKVFYKAIFRDEEDVSFSIPKSKKSGIAIFDPEGEEIFKSEYDVTAKGILAGEYSIQKDASLGQYRIDTCLLENKKCTNNATTYFSVEEYKKPEYEVTVDTDRTDLIDKDTSLISFVSKYYFGLPFEGSMRFNIKAKQWFFDRYEGGYVFEETENVFCGGICRMWYNIEKNIVSGELSFDKDGKAYLEHKFDIKDYSEEKQCSLEYVIQAIATDDYTNKIYSEKSIIAHLGEYYIGLKTDDYFVKNGEEISVDIVSVDPQGRKVGDKDITAYLIRREWVEAGKEDNKRWVLKEKEVDKKKVTTGVTGKTSLDFSIPKKLSGEYKILIESMDSRENILRSSINVYVSSRDNIAWGRNNSFGMEVFTDKNEYKVTEDIGFYAKSPFISAKGLLTIERGDFYLHKVVDINEALFKTTLPVFQKYIPNIFVSLIVFKYGATPDFKMGVTNVLIDNNKKKINIELETDKKEYLPADTLKLKIHTTNDEGAPIKTDISVRVTDASVLALKDDNKINILEYFYHIRGYITNTFSSLVKQANPEYREHVLRDISGTKEDSVLEAAPMATKQNLGSGKRAVFEDTAYFKTGIETDDDGYIELEIPLPDNLTTWNIEVLGISDDTKVGTSNIDIITNKPLFIRPQFPRFFRVNDTVDLGVIIQNTKEEEIAAEIELSIDNLRIEQDKTIKKVLQKGENRCFYKVYIPKDIGNYSIINLKVKTGSYTDEIELKIPIEDFSTEEVIASSGYFDDDSMKEVIRLPKLIESGLGSIEINLSATLINFIEDSFNYLIDYSYGCTEQVMTKLVALSVIKKAQSLPNTKDILAPKDKDGEPINIDEAIEENLILVYKNQRYDGGFSYWYQSRESAPYLSAYILYGLNTIEGAGYKIKKTVKDKLVKYLTSYIDKIVGRLEDSPDGETKKIDKNILAYILFALKESGISKDKLIISLYKDIKSLNILSKSYLLMMLDNKDQVKEVIDIIQNEITIDQRGAFIDEDKLSYVYMTNNIKNTCSVLQALARKEINNPLIPKLIAWLVTNKKEGDKRTTQDTISILVSFTEFLGITEETASEYDVDLNINGQKVKDIQVRRDNVFKNYNYTTSLSDLNFSMQDNKIGFEKNGEGRLYYDIVMKYFVPIETVNPRNEGFEINRQYYKTDDKNHERPLKQAKIGDTLKGKLKIIVNEERNFVVIENPLPAGFELVNFNLKTSDKTLKTEPDIYFDHIDTKDIMYEESEYRFYQSFWSNKEFRDDKLLYFADILPKGVYEIEFYVNVVSSGEFRHPPAIIREMYYPEIFGRTSGDIFNVTR